MKSMAEVVTQFFSNISTYLIAKPDANIERTTSIREKELIKPLPVKVNPIDIPGAKPKKEKAETRYPAIASMINGNVPSPPDIGLMLFEMEGDENELKAGLRRDEKMEEIEQSKIHASAERGAEQLENVKKWMENEKSEDLRRNIRRFR